MKLPIETKWTKIPGPNFVGGPDGRIKDINDWLVLVKSHLLFTTAVQLTRIEANDTIHFEGAKINSVRMIEERLYGEIRRDLLKLHHDLKFCLDPMDNNLLDRLDQIISSIPWTTP